MNIHNYVFRVDAGADKGIGHFRRCLVLGESLKKTGSSVVFVMSSFPAELKKFVESKNIKVVEYKKKIKSGSDEDAEQLIDLMKYQKNSWIILDGYEFHKSYREKVKQHIADYSMIIQDCPGDYSDADIVLDQNVNINTTEYYLGSRGKLLSGPEYCLFNGQYELRNKRLLRTEQKANILVTLGGADIRHLTLAVVEALMGLDINISVVLGPACSLGTSDFKKFNNKVQVNDSPIGLDTLIANADIGVMSLGITTWEMCFYGLPFIMLESNPNQRRIVNWFVEKELATDGLYKGEFVPDYFIQCVEKYLNDSNMRRKCSKRLMEIVDGRGTERVIREMESRLYA